MSFLSRLIWKIQGERPVFRTHRAPFHEGGIAVGDVVAGEDGYYVVTRRVELPRVSLPRGGSVREWEIWGRRVPEEAMEESMHRAAERILDESGQKEPEEEEPGRRRSDPDRDENPS